MDWLALPLFAGLDIERGHRAQRMVSEPVFRSGHGGGPQLADKTPGARGPASLALQELKRARRQRHRLRKRVFGEPGADREVEQANKVVVHGINAKKFTNISTLWNAQAAGCFGQGTGQIIAEVVANGEYWPDSIIPSGDTVARGETWAKYGQV